MLKFKGTQKDLSGKLFPLGGLWDLTNGNRNVLGLDNGCIINWYFSTGTIQVQGNPAASKDVEEQIIKLLNIKDVEPVHTHTDCRSENGITVGLIESLISISRVLKGRLATIDDEAVLEALNDLHNDDDVKFVLSRSKTII